MSVDQNASPICRGKNLTMETVFSFVNAMPKKVMSKAEFNRIAESHLEGWTQTHSQIARQIAFYYEKDDMCYPRFTTSVSCVSILSYMKNWASKYFIPNIYTPSLHDRETVNIYAFLKSQIANGQTNFDEACKNIYGIELNNTDKVRVYLTNFTDLVVDKDKKMYVNEGVCEISAENVYPIVSATNAEDYFHYFDVALDGVDKMNSGTFDSREPLQQIFFGAPGTGKSHEIKKQTAGQSVVRTTFHPDSDYSTFVGAYKPTTKEIPVTTVIGTKAVPVEDSQGNPVIESKIVYEFVEQAFLKAYVNAWTLLAENKPQFLIVEEINRGNCAQIFGDLFQLLDRNDFGFSDYPITADKDLQKHLKKAFENLNISGADIEGEYEESNDSIAAKVKSGEVLLLPKNLYIWATMNTSDQSLFPIDSAFKRRWDWKYIPIDTKKENWSIRVNSSAYSWSDFLEKVNEKIGSTTSSEDKKLGFYFCKANNTEISADRFVSKVLFYIYNDVFKDYGYEDPMFKNEGKVMPFQSFYNTDGSVNEAIVDILLKNLGVKKKDSAIDGDEGAFDDENTLSPTKRMKFIRLWDQELKIEDYKTNFGMYSAALDVIAQKCGIDNVIDVVKKHGLHRYNKPLLSKIDPRDAAYVYQNTGYYILKTGVNVVACNSLFKNLQRDLNFEMEIIRDE
ncbi:MAG: AAA family ATPase [Candidatus Saccharibacteria bacterium]|nr:AAA family ATPase [Candidatus Saccharibacteria bacterium]